MTALGARLSARARAEGRPEPLDGIEAIDRKTLLELGATEEEIASTVIQGTWLAKLFHTAGDTDAAALLYQESMRWPSASGSGLVKSHRGKLGARRGWRARLSSLLPD